MGRDFLTVHPIAGLSENILFQDVFAAYKYHDNGDVALLSVRRVQHRLFHSRSV